MGVIRGKELFIAHVGDSRAILGRMKNGKLISHDLTNDHHPDLSSEKQRIEKCGGEIKKVDEKSPYRVFWKNSMIPGLAMTRAIGDVVCQSLGVIPEPDVAAMVLGADDKYLLICSDGVWEFLSSQQVIDAIGVDSSISLQLKIEGLAKKAYDLWIENEKEVSDDITCMLINLS